MTISGVVRTFVATRTVRMLVNPPVRGYAMVLLAHYAAADTETLEPPLHARFNLAETVEWSHGCVF